MAVIFTTDVRKLLANGWWALKVIWATNAPLTAGLGLATLARGVVPAGLALFACGLINVFLTDGSVGTVRMDAVFP